MSAFSGGIKSIVIGTDNSVIGSGNSVSIPLEDLIGLDFTEDMFRSSISGTLVVGSQTAWDAKLGGVQGTEWVTFTFNSTEYEYDDNGKLVGSSPYTITQRFKVYKISQSLSEANTYTTYTIHFTTYQFLVDSVKFEKHLNNNHIGPISTDYNEENREQYGNQDYGFVNKIFDAAGFDLDVTINDKNGTPALDIEATSNWINWIPSYMDDRNTTDVLADSYAYGSTNVLRNDRTQKDARPKKIFEVLNELAENAVSKENPNASNFFVWNDLKGWHFRSVDSFLRDREGEVDRVYTYEISDTSVPDGKEITRIIDLSVIKQVDFMNLLHQQALSSKVIYYELNPDNPFAAYYLTLPPALMGLQRVIGPAGIDNSVSNTLIETQAIYESGLSYDYILDYDKWAKVEQYPLIQGFENQYTDYTLPSFLEVPPKYLTEPIGNKSWFGSSPYDYNQDVFNYTYYSHQTLYNFDVTNPHEYFKTTFLRQTELSGEKFRIVHDNIKMPIIEALREYYLAVLQRLYYEHNLVIINGLNTLEAGEGTLGRGPDKQYCDYCISREDAVGSAENFIRQQPGGETFLTDLRSKSVDTLDYENFLLSEYYYGADVGMTVCTKKDRDLRTLNFGGPAEYYQGIYQGNVEEINEYIRSFPIIETENVPLLEQNLIGAQYPRCFSPEPLLPYNGEPVDCVSIRQKMNNIPSECALVREYLGPEYVSPSIRGWWNNPISFNNLTFWNGYWINPRFKLPNYRNLKQIFNQTLDLNSLRYGYDANNFYEKLLFLKDFIEDGDANPVVAPEVMYNPVGGTDSVSIPSHINYFEVRYDFETSSVGGVIEVGDTKTSTTTRTLTSKRNPYYYFAKTCVDLRLCGGKDVASETIEIPYVSKIESTYVEGSTSNGTGFDGEPFFPTYWEITNIETSTLSVEFPARYFVGRPYSYADLTTIPFNISDYKGDPINSAFTSFLQQFGYGDFDESSVLQNLDLLNSSIVPNIAAIGNGLRNQGIYTNYFPNQNLGLYDKNRPIHTKEDWQRFLDCNGTCVGDTENTNVTDTSKAIEYAKYCSYAWNRYWQTPKQQPMYRRAQVALIQSQEIEITIPNDMNLAIGNLVQVNLPKSTSLGDEGEIIRQGRINPISGKYLVTGIRRSFGGDNRQAMRVRLNRDSLPYDPNTQST